MGKIRVATLGDKSEQEQKRRAEARRQTKKSKKTEKTTTPVPEPVAAQEKPEVPEVKEVKKDKKPKEIKIKTRSRRYQEVIKLVDRSKLYPLPQAIELLKKTSLTRFDATVELHLSLSLQVLGGKNPPAGGLRGTVTLPHGTGKQIKVAIADEKILAEIAAGKINFDILVAHPTMMPKLAKVAKILGPKGLMPNPKAGTVGENPEELALSLSKGKVNFKTEPDQPLIHLSVGKVSFADKNLAENITAALDAVGRSKISRATLTSTMGPGIKLEV